MDPDADAPADLTEREAMEWYEDRDGLIYSSLLLEDHSGPSGTRSPAALPRQSSGGDHRAALWDQAEQRSEQLKPPHG